MKLFSSEQPHSILPIFFVSVAGHMAIIAAGGAWLLTPHFSVQQGRNSVEVVLLSAPTAKTTNKSVTVTPQATADLDNTLEVAELSPTPQLSNDMDAIPIPKKPTTKIVQNKMTPKEQQLTKEEIQQPSSPPKNIDLTSKGNPLKGNDSETFINNLQQGAIVQTDYSGVNNPTPKYPRIARQNGWEGTVVIRVFVKENGRPSEILIDQSSGHAVLDQAAMLTIKNWQFSIMQRANVKIASWIKIPVKFQLYD